MPIPSGSEKRSLAAVEPSPMKYRGETLVIDRRALTIALAICSLGAAPAALAPAGGSTYYVSGSGSDLASGLSQANAWATIARVNQQTLVPGDTVLFESGKSFTGTILLGPPEGGTPAEPITFASYGPQRALISAGTQHGFDLYNVAGIRIRDLVVAGSGIDTSNGIGISFYADLPGNVKLPWIRIEDVRVTGFRRGGISIGSYNGRTGFQDVRVEGCKLDHNGNNGMAVWGFYSTSWGQTLDDYPHRSIYIGHNSFVSNWGDPLLTNRHTGSGVEVAQAALVLIEYNEAFDNGRLNVYPGGGPVGIWMWDTYQGVIQHNESHHNSSASIDGGGFDMDGGCVRSVIQYNYSHDNDGPGFMVAQFTNGARPMRDVTVRYNVSERDGGRGGSGALQLWNGDTGGPAIYDALFHNNTVYVATKSPWIPRAFRAFGPGNFERSGFANNIFFSEGTFVWLGELSGSYDPLVAGNLYFARNGSFVIRDHGTSYFDLASWRAATGQESLLGIPSGYQMDPQLVAPGSGGTIGNPDLLGTLAAYQLDPASLAFDLAVPLPSFGVLTGSTDFWGGPIPLGAGYDLGAHEGR